MIKGVTLFLLAMAILAFVGRWFRRKPPSWPGQDRKALPRPPAPVVCIHCATPIPGGGPCPCGRPQR